MVKLHFKLSELGKVEISLTRPETLDTLIARCTADSHEDIGGYIATRRGKVITGATLVEDGDEITVLPAISGG